MSLFEDGRPFLRALPAQDRRALLALGRARGYAPGEVVLRENDTTTFVVADRQRLGERLPGDRAGRAADPRAARQRRGRRRPGRRRPPPAQRHRHRARPAGRGGRARRPVPRLPRHPARRDRTDHAPVQLPAAQLGRRTAVAGLGEGAAAARRAPGGTGRAHLAPRGRAVSTSICRCPSTTSRRPSAPPAKRWPRCCGCCASRASYGPGRGGWPCSTSRCCGCSPRDARSAAGRRAGPLPCVPRNLRRLCKRLQPPSPAPAMLLHVGPHQEVQ
ncbi:hypothetical protein SRIMM317S_04517 [Streptomyces rimosus subsp. rimosus]